MITPNDVRREINGMIAYLVEVGLSSDQHYAVRRDEVQGCTRITFPHAERVSIALKNRNYADIYGELANARAYNVRMPDGALIQMMYVFRGEALESHRLAFFPSPDLEEFQNNPDIYLEDVVYSEVVAKNIVPFPVRFDYDIREGVHRELVHPRSHLTLGQYENCRIPVTSALPPSWFMDFILRNFYHTAFTEYAERLPRLRHDFEESILPTERKIVHLLIPRGA